MEFFSEMSEVHYCNSFKWKINVFNRNASMYESEDVFKYTIKSNDMDFPEVGAKWNLEITEIPGYEFYGETDYYSGIRYFKADFRVYPSEESFNEIFSFQLKVKGSNHIIDSGISLPHEDQIKFKIPKNENFIEIEAFCRVRKMVTHTLQVNEENRDGLFLDSPEPAPSTHNFRYEEIPAESDHGSFYESLLADPADESYQSEDRNHISESPLLVDENDEKEGERQRECLCVDDWEELKEPEQENSMNSYLNGSLYEDAASEQASSSQNSSFEKIEESSREVIDPMSSPSSTSSKAKSETGTDYACLESIPDEEESASVAHSKNIKVLGAAIQRLRGNGVEDEPAASNDLSRLFYSAIDKVLMRGNGVEAEPATPDALSLLKLPFFSNRNATIPDQPLMGESSSLVENRIHRKLSLVDLDPEATENFEQQELEVSAEVHVNSPVPSFEWCECGFDLHPQMSEMYHRMHRSSCEKAALESNAKDAEQSGATAESIQLEEAAIHDDDETAAGEADQSYATDEEVNQPRIQIGEDSEKIIDRAYKELMATSPYHRYNSQTESKEAQEAAEKALVERISNLHFQKMKSEADNRAKLFILASKMVFSPLMADCCQQLAKIISRSNYLEIWSIALDMGSEQLEKVVVDFVVSERYIHYFNNDMPKDLLDKVKKSIEISREKRNQFKYL